MLAAGLCCVVPRVASDAYAQTKPGTDTKPGTEAKPVEEKFHSPFGGTKDSSFGPKEQGPAALEFYSDYKTVYLKY